MSILENGTTMHHRCGGDNVPMIATSTAVGDNNNDDYDDGDYNGDADDMRTPSAAVNHHDYASVGAGDMTPLCSSTMMPPPLPILNVHLLSAEQQCRLIDRLLPSLTRTALTHAAVGTVWHLFSNFCFHVYSVNVIVCRASTSSANCRHIWLSVFWTIWVRVL